jgi:sulfatase maturation enzyme AslB (radical SAM superfamily)
MRLCQRFCDEHCEKYPTLKDKKNCKSYKHRVKNSNELIKALKIISSLKEK